MAESKPNSPLKDRLAAAKDSLDPQRRQRILAGFTKNLDNFRSAIQQYVEHLAPMLDPKELDPKLWRTVRKSGVTRARPLTEQDFRDREGMIVSMEGPMAFKPGDFLAVGPKGEEYPIPAAVIQQTKRAVGEPDAEGWADYETTVLSRAAVIDHPFRVQDSKGKIFLGKKGDIIVLTGNEPRIVDREVFTRTYGLADQVE
jgi:hypothetical protein